MPLVDRPIDGQMPKGEKWRANCRPACLDHVASDTRQGVVCYLLREG